MKTKLTDKEFTNDIKLINKLYNQGRYTKTEAKKCIMAEVAVYLKSL